MSIEPVDSGMITEDYSTRLKIKPAVVGLEVKAESIELGLRESSGVKDEVTPKFALHNICNRNITCFRSNYV